MKTEKVILKETFKKDRATISKQDVVANVNKASIIFVEERAKYADGTESITVKIMVK